MTLGRAVTVAYGGRRIDRHGRALAHLFDRAGRWIQGEMLARETAARRARRGIWRFRFYAVREPETAGRYVGGFELVEGRVLDAARVRGRVYLNFGPDWRSDFTVTIAPAARRRFEAAGIDPLDYEGRWIRARGWVKSFNGPMIEATHPEQIEVLGPSGE